MSSRYTTERRVFALLAIALGVALIGLSAWRHRPGPRAEASSGTPVVAREEHASTVVHVARPASLSGAVRTGVGAPIKGARVCAARVEGEALGPPHVTCVETDAAGQYSLSPVAPDGYSITAEAEGFAPSATATPVFVAEGEDRGGVDFVLSEGGAKIAGVVMDATGGPVPGAIITVSRATPPFRAVAATSGPDGRFGCWTEPGPTIIKADAQGYVSARGFRVAPSSDVTITLTPGSTIAGTVASAKDGQAVPSVEVRAVPQGGWASPELSPGVSDAEGAFAVKSLEPGIYTLVAEGDGWRGRGEGEVAIGLAQTIEHVQVTVYPATSVEGKVVFAKDGQPCREGSVSMGPTAPGMTSAYDPPQGPTDVAISNVPSILATIGPGGDVRFPSVTSGRYHVTVQCKDHVISEGPTTLDVASTPVTGLSWKVESGLELEVTVVDAAERPVPLATFLFLYPPRAPDAPRPATQLSSDETGTYRFSTMLFPGKYTLEPTNGYDGAPADFELRRGEAEAKATLRLVGTGSIDLRVQAANGEAVDAVTVTADRLDESSQLGPHAAGDGGAAPAARPSSYGGVSLGKGRFRIGPLPEGRYDVRATDGVNPPARPAPSNGVVVGTAPVAALITLDRSGVIRGRVVDGARQALADMWVSAACQAESAEPDAAADPIAGTRTFGGAAAPAGKRVISDLDGHFTLSGVAPRTKCQLRAEQPYGGMGVLDDVGPGDDVVIAVPDLGSLQGTALTASGRATGPFTLEIVEVTTGRERSVKVSPENGIWTVPRIQPGHLDLSANAEDGTMAHAELDLAPGQTASGIRLEFRSLQAAQAPRTTAATP